MSNEGKFFDQKDKEKKKKKDKEKQENYFAKLAEIEEKKKEIRDKIELAHLKRLVQEGLIKESTVKAIIQGENLDLSNFNEEIKAIISKIEEIEELDKDCSLIPKELRFTIKEYIDATKNDDKKLILLGKIDASLDCIYMGSSGGSLLSSLFSALFFNLTMSQNTQTIQGNLIDVKRSLN